MTEHRQPIFALVLCGALTLGGCVGGGDRYPDLNLRDFERAQGTFTAPPPTALPPQPTPISVSTMSELEAALASARDQHARFVAQAAEARPLVAAASGTGLEDNRWPVAMIEIAALDSLSGETSSLLAELDSLYANATLSFSEREQIAAGQAQVAEYAVIQSRTIDDLIELLGGR